MSDILLVLLMHQPDLSGHMQRNAIEKATDTLLNNDHHIINIYVDRRPIILPNESIKTSWSKSVAAYNRVLTDIQFWDYDYLLWIEPKVSDYPCNLPSRLIEANPEGITSPLILPPGIVNATDGSFEDREYVHTVTMVPTSIYLNDSESYTDHPTNTQHFAICELARSEGKRVGVDLSTIATLQVP